MMLPFSQVLVAAAFAMVLCHAPNGAIYAVLAVAAINEFFRALVIFSAQQAPKSQAPVERVMTPYGPVPEEDE